MTWVSNFKVIFLHLLSLSDEPWDWLFCFHWLFAMVWL